MTEINSVGLWRAINELEASVYLILEKDLQPFAKPVQNCYECGVEVPTLNCKVEESRNLYVAALFLKRTLNDLRAIWNLLLLGYTSQAASIAAATFENALITTCTAINDDKTKKILKNVSGDSPWTVMELCKMEATQFQDEARIIGKAFTKKDYEISWMGLYSAYKWLCKIKHPTLPSALHDALSTSFNSEEYVVMAAPDYRKEDLPNKFTIMSITVSRIHSAIRNFAFGMQLDLEDARVIDWLERFNEIIPGCDKAFNSLEDTTLPFNISNTKIATDYRKLHDERKFTAED